MSVVVDFNRAVAKGARYSKAVLPVLAAKVRFNMRPFVPYQTGALRDSADRMSDLANGRIVYGGEAAVAAYAIPQYEKPMNHTTPGTTDHWFDAAKAQYASDWIRCAKEATGKVR